MNFHYNLDMLYNPAFSVSRRNADPIDGLQLLKNVASKQNEVLYRPVYKLHNLYIVREGCCQGMYCANRRDSSLSQLDVCFQPISNCFFHKDLTQFSLRFFKHLPSN